MDSKMDSQGLISLIFINSILFIGSVTPFYSETHNGSTLILPLTEDDFRSPLTLNSSFAKQWCSSIDATLPRITDERDQKNIVQFIRNATRKYQFAGIENIFVNNINHTLYDNWTWVNGQTNQGFTVKQVSRRADGFFFGYLWTTDYRISESRPFEPRRFVCETSTTMRNSSHCGMRSGKRCYWKKDVMLTWYRARQACFKEGGDLSSFEQLNERNMKVVLKDLGLIERNSYWVGISKGGWRWNGTGIDSEIKYSNWKADRPSNYSAKCSCLNKQPNNDYQWIDCDCGQSYPFICKRNGTLVSSTALYGPTSKVSTVGIKIRSTVGITTRSTEGIGKRNGTSWQLQSPTKEPHTTSLLLETTSQSSSVGQMPNTTVISETVKFALLLSSCALAVVVISAVTVFIIRRRRNRTRTTANTNELSVYPDLQECRGNDAVYAAIQQRTSSMQNDYEELDL